MMKIMVGMNSIDDYIDFVKAGADEIFCGYIPDWWYEIKGMHVPLNRREVNYIQVQIGSRSELRILKKMMDDYHIPVTITLNALGYGVNDYPLIKRMIKECKEDGFNRFIVADLALLRSIQSIEDIVIHISGEAGEINPLAIQYYTSLNASRIIFPRHITLAEMKECMTGLEYEAFVLNEKCHYFGGYCNSMHSDHLCHMCLVPYHQNSQDSFTMQEGVIGETGCGLCALYKMNEIGITHLKLVSRGNYKENTIEDIQALKRAMDLVELSTNEKEYIQYMKKELFPQGCSGNCYYVENGGRLYKRKYVKNLS